MNGTRRSRWLIIAPLVLLLATAFAGAYYAGHRLGANSHMQMSGVGQDSTTPSGLVVRGGYDRIADRTDRTTPLECVFELHNPTNRAIRVAEFHCGCACMVHRLQTDEILPGATVALSITVRTFDSYRGSYRQVVQIKTDRGNTDLSIAGKLPLPQEVMYRPETLYMDPLPGSSVAERAVYIRIPKQCCKAISIQDLKWSGDSKVCFQIAEQTSTELYREFLLTVSVSSEISMSAGGTIRLETGCSAIEIQVHPSWRASR